MYRIQACIKFKKKKKILTSFQKSHCLACEHKPINFILEKKERKGVGEF